MHKVFAPIERKKKLLTGPYLAKYSKQLNVKPGFALGAKRYDTAAEKRGRIYFLGKYFELDCPH